MFAATHVYFNIQADGDVPSIYIPACCYGISCYRQNPEHFTQFSHTHKHFDCTVKVNTFSSLVDLDYAIKSVFDCTNTAFRVYFEDYELDSDTYFVLVRDFVNQKTPIPLVVEFEKLSKWKNVKSCSHCTKTIFGDFYYECNHCPSYILCDCCEENNFGCHYHQASHLFTKVYVHQQSIPHSKNKDEKLDEIISNLSDLKLSVSKIKQEPQVVEVKKESPKDVEQAKKNHQTLVQLKEMGFVPSSALCDLVVKHKCNLQAILDDLC